MIPGKDALLVDIGACSNLCGKEFAYAILTDNHKHLTKTEFTNWGHYKRAKPYSCGGIGHGTKECYNNVHAWGCLSNGRILNYNAPIVQDPFDNDFKDNTPALWGIQELRELNAFIGCRSDTVSLVPEGAAVSYPSGTIHLQCERSQGGHMMLVMSNWQHHKPGQEPIERARL